MDSSTVTSALQINSNRCHNAIRPLRRTSAGLVHRERKDSFYSNIALNFDNSWNTCWEDVKQGQASACARIGGNDCLDRAQFGAHIYEADIDSFLLGSGQSLQEQFTRCDIETWGQFVPASINDARIQTSWMSCNCYGDKILSPQQNFHKRTCHRGKLSLLHAYVCQPSNYTIVSARVRLFILCCLYCRPFNYFEEGKRHFIGCEVTSCNWFVCL